MHPVCFGVSLRSGKWGPADLFEHHGKRTVDEVHYIGSEAKCNNTIESARSKKGKLHSGGMGLGQGAMGAPLIIRTGYPTIRSYRSHFDC